MVFIIKKETVDEIKNASKPVVVDVYATWCGPCQQMKPAFEELAQEYSNSYMFASLNVDEAREVAISYGVSSVPTFLFLKNGELKGKVTGYMSKEDLLEKIVAALGS